MIIDKKLFNQIHEFVESIKVSGSVSLTERNNASKILELMNHVNNSEQIKPTDYLIIFDPMDGQDMKRVAGKLPERFLKDFAEGVIPYIVDLNTLEYVSQNNQNLPIPIQPIAL